MVFLYDLLYASNVITTWFSDNHFSSQTRQQSFPNIVWISIAVSALFFFSLVEKICANSVLKQKLPLPGVTNTQILCSRFTVYAKKPFWKYVIRKRYIMLRNYNMMYHGWPKLLPSFQIISCWYRKWLVSTETLHTNLDKYHDIAIYPKFA